MIINGREVGFAYTMRAYRDISALCKDGKLANLKEFLNGEGGDKITNNAKFIATLSAAHNAKYQPEVAPLTVDEILDLEPDQFAEINEAAVLAYTGKPTITAKEKTDEKNAESLRGE